MRLRRSSGFWAVVALGLAFAGSDRASALDLNPFPLIVPFSEPGRDGFVGGKVKIAGGNESIFSTGFAQDSRGRIFIGSSGFISPEFFLRFAALRLQKNGERDLGFGKKGIFLGTDFPYGPTYFSSSVKVDSSDRLIQIGTAFGGEDDDIFITRLNEAGELDTSFNKTGMVSLDLDFGSTDRANGMLIDPKGRILIAITHGPKLLTDIGVLRLLPDGSRDPEFGLLGTAVAPYGDHQNNASRIALQKDGKILVIGVNGVQPILARFTENGQPDPQFGQNGIVAIPMPGEGNSVDKVAQLPDGKIILLGSSPIEPGPRDALLIRLHSDGKVDTSFGDKGYLTRDIWMGSGNVGAALLVKNDGKIIVAGEMGLGDSAAMSLMRLLPDGSFDPAFGAGSGRVVTLTADMPTEILGIQTESDGRLLVHGESRGFNQIQLFRHESDGYLVE